MRKPATVVALGARRRVASARISTTLGAIAALAIASVAATASAQPAPNSPQPPAAPPGSPPSATPGAPPQPATAPTQPPSLAPPEVGQPLIPPPPVTKGAPAATTPPPPPVSRPDPAGDSRALVKQGPERPLPDGNVGTKPSDVYAEDWWSSARPSFTCTATTASAPSSSITSILGRRDINQAILCRRRPTTTTSTSTTASTRSFADRSRPAARTRHGERVMTTPRRAPTCASA